MDAWTCCFCNWVLDMSMLPTMAPFARLSPSYMGKESNLPSRRDETMTSTDSNTPEASVFVLFCWQEVVRSMSSAMGNKFFIVFILVACGGLVIVLGKEQLYFVDGAILAGLGGGVDVQQIVVGCDDAV